MSPGCAACYMFRDQRRYGNDPEIVTRAAPATFGAPLKWKDGKLIFTCSWSDWFHEDADEWRDEAWAIVRECPQHTFQILTKRPELIPERLPPDWGDGYPNVWLGVSIENARHTFRADLLREVPAALRFISAEPLLGSLYAAERREAKTVRVGESVSNGPGDRPPDADEGHVDPIAPAILGQLGALPSSERRSPLDLTGIGWVIVGGESGSRADARPVHPAWVREIRDAIQLAADARDDGYGERIAFHFKQWGSWTPDPYGRDSTAVWLMPDGTRHTYFAADIYDIDLSGAMRVRYAGPRPGDGGKYLDGTDWCEIPDRPDVGQLSLA